MITGQQLSVTEEINLLRTFSPNKGKNMNVNPNTNTVGDAGIEGVKHFYIDAEGNRIEIPFDIDGQTYSGGEATPEEATIFVAEDAADHPVTVH